MADIFISYAQKDRERVEPLAEALAAAGGWSVWWDREIPFGKPFDQVIEEQLTVARCIIVVWSNHSIYSDWVIEEAQSGRQRNILIPILIDHAIPPFGFRRIQTADLTNWKNSQTFPEFQKLLNNLGSILGPAPPTSDHLEKRAQQEQQEKAPRAAEEQAEQQAASRRTPEEPTRSGKVANGQGPGAHRKPPARWWLRRRAVIAALLLLISGPAGFVLMWRPDFTVFRDAPFAPEMVVLPAGEFLMGSANGDSEAYEAYDNEKPQHRVQIGYRLAVSRSPVTFDEWDAYVAEGGTNYRPDDQGWGRGRRPVINTSWNDTKQYVAWLSRKTGQTYHLLSEAGWEYAARAGTTTKRWWGNDITRQNANYGGKIGKTTEVGSYPESPFKLYDMLGNVWEWVEDCWNENYVGAPGNGVPWVTGDCSRRVLRGGSWNDSPRQVRSASRNGGSADNRINDVGFRVARAF